MRPPHATPCALVCKQPETMSCWQPCSRPTASMQASYSPALLYRPRILMPALSNGHLCPAKRLLSCYARYLDHHAMLAARAPERLAENISPDFAYVLPWTRLQSVLPRSPHACVSDSLLSCRLPGTTTPCWQPALWDVWPASRGASWPPLPARQPVLRWQPC